MNGGQSALARYGDVYFDECIAGTKNDHLLQGGDGDLITMVDSSNHPISEPTRETDELDQDPVRLRTASRRCGRRPRSPAAARSWTGQPACDC